MQRKPYRGSVSLGILLHFRLSELRAALSRPSPFAGPAVSRPVPSVLVFGLCNDRLGYPNGFITSAVAWRRDGPSRFFPLKWKLYRWIN